MNTGKERKKASSQIFHKHTNMIKEGMRSIYMEGEGGKTVQSKGEGHCVCFAIWLFGKVRSVIYLLFSY